MTTNCPSWCQRQEADLCTREGEHTGRVWHYDADGLTIRLAAVAYIEPALGLSVGAPQPRVIVENVECPEAVSQNLSVDELDGLIGMLTRARADIARDIAWSAESLAVAS